MIIYVNCLRYLLFTFNDHVYGIIATLMLINAKLDDDLNANRSKPVSHEPLAILLCTTCTYALLYLLCWKKIPDG